MQVKNKKYDYVVVGADLTGILIATALSKMTTSVLLIDARDLSQPLYESRPKGLFFMPATDSSEKALAFLEKQLNRPLPRNRRTLPPEILEGQEFKSFVGFGETEPQHYSEIQSFLTPHSFHFEDRPSDWMEHLLRSVFQGEISSRTEITQMHFVDDRLTEVTLNGQKKVEVLNLIYNLPVNGLGKLAAEKLSGRLLQKVLKAEGITAVAIDFEHKNSVSESKAIQIVFSNSAEEPTASLAQFTTPMESHWMSFINDREAEDAEMLAQVIKRIKRQAKRAYPQAMEDILFERITVMPSFGGHFDGPLTASSTLPQVENLWISHASTHSQKGWVGALLKAEMILATLGFSDLQEGLAPNAES